MTFWPPQAPSMASGSGSLALASSIRRRSAPPLLPRCVHQSCGVTGTGVCLTRQAAAKAAQPTLCMGCLRVRMQSRLSQCAETLGGGEGGVRGASRVAHFI